MVFRSTMARRQARLYNPARYELPPVWLGASLLLSVRRAVVAVVDVVGDVRSMAWCRLLSGSMLAILVLYLI